MRSVTIHPLADCSEYASLGPGSVVWAHAVVTPDVKTGANCVIGSCAYIGRGSQLGNGVRIQHGAFVPNHTMIGDRVFIGPNATMTDDRHPVAGNSDYRAEPPVIEDDVSIGAGAVILPGVRLGRGCLVGAGAVVTKNVPPGAVVIGNPAKETNP